ncbi:MAG: metallophosphoesterase, partial [Clostridia bacterium]|nr:metallophosphoesterase [Clostridia bacterium]
MKIIHTADIHLDSPLSGVKDSKRRRFELLTALANMSEYANNYGVQAIIVAGDLFDDKYTS